MPEASGHVDIRKIAVPIALVASIVGVVILVTLQFASFQASMEALTTEIAAVARNVERNSDRIDQLVDLLRESYEARLQAHAVRIERLEVQQTHHFQTDAHPWMRERMDLHMRTEHGGGR